VDLSVRRAVLAFSDNQARQLQSATEAQSKYLSFLSHDLRGGLNGVFLMIEVLKRELAGEERLSETVGDLDIMRRSLLETVGTMDRFLHAERFRKGKVQVRPAPVDLRNLLQELAAHISYQAKDKGLEVKVDVPRDVTVVSDRELLTLIFQNLLSNAIKYTVKGAVHIGGKLTEDNSYLLWVKDDGPGIAPEKLNQLFAPFSRGETYGQPGVGLGLSIARQATEYLHARLWAESKPGEGSTFFVQMPKELKSKTP
jgi:signal transduction histidine kinase